MMQEPHRATFTIMLMALALLLPTAASGRTIHVPAEAATIQEAVDSAASGDTVVVADGTYTGPGNRNIDFGGRNIVLRSENGPEVTIIDCLDSGRAFIIDSGEDSSAVIDGFTITNGFVMCGCGGAMYIADASPTVKNCIFAQNMAHDGSGSAGSGEGGAICCIRGAPNIRDCIFTDNFAKYASPMDFSFGGGIYFIESSPTVANCFFDGNSARSGSGLHAWYSTPTLEYCVFQENALWYFNDFGGGVTLWECTTATIANCVFTGNSAGHGGGVSLIGANANLNFCVFDDNSAGSGGAIYVSGYSLASNNCTFSANRASYAGAGVFLHHISSMPSMTAMNSVLVFSTQGEVISCSDTGIEVALSCCNVFGNVGGDWSGCIADQYGINGNFSADPLFCDTSVADFHITDNSPCAPTNNECGVLIGALDVGCYCCVNRGNVDGSDATDVGDLTWLVAYLFQGGPAPPCLGEGDVDGSGSIDVGDLTYLVAYLFLGGPAPPPC